MERSKQASAPPRRPRQHSASERTPLNMAETAPSLLSAWSNYFVVIGSSAAALTGLLFVVISLITTRERTEGAREGTAAFTTPTVMHFATALFVSGALLAPWHSLVHAGALIALIGLFGVVYILRVILRTRRLTIYTPDLEDWIWYTIVPLGAYSVISAGAIGLMSAPAQALFALAGGVMLLIFIGIRNAWDTVTYIAIVMPVTPREEARKEGSRPQAR